jgi:predicted DNA binding protein
VTRGPKPKLTREQAMEIRTAYQRGRVGTTTLAARYGVSTSMVSKILRGQHSTVADEPNIARQPLASVRGRYSLRPPS